MLMGKKIVNIVSLFLGFVSLNAAIFYCQKENQWGKGRPALRGQLTQTDTALQLCRILLRLRFSILLFHFCIFWYYLFGLDREAKIVLTFIILTNCCRVGDPLDNEDEEKKGVYLPYSRVQSRSRDFCQVLEVSVSEKKSRFWFRKIWSRKKSISFGEYGLGK